jgi:hypothetical protein
LGQIDREEPAFSSLAASIAEELICMGVKAVIAAGWAVNDRAAVTFAATFYHAMTGGKKFGEAVRLARRETYEQHPSFNTWGAYQCYGNPDFMLRSNLEEDRPTRTSEDACCSQREYVDRLRDIAANARSGGAARIAPLQEQVERLNREIPEHWRDGMTMAAFGEAWAALGDKGKAIEAYGEAIRHPDAEAPLRAVEQLANLQSRHAREQPTASEGIREATEMLEWMLRLAETGERLSMLGGNYKRLAMMASSDSERQEMLEKARAHYEKAH